MDRDKSGAINLFLSSIKSERIRAIIMILVAVTPIVWQQGLQAGWWGFLEGKIERINKQMAVMHIGMEPTHRVKIINTDEDLLEVLLYTSGTALIVRRTIQADGSMYQQHRWLTEGPLEEAMTAFAAAQAWAQVAPVRPANEPYRDRIIEWVDDRLAKIERIYTSGCIEIIIMDVATGQIEEVLSRACPQKGKG